VQLLQVAQRAVDLPRAIAFYEMLLGQPVAAHYPAPGLAFFALGETRLLLEPGAPSAMLYLRVDSVREKIEALRAAGVAIVAEPHVIFAHEDDTLGPAGTQEWMAFFTDSEGNTVGLASQESP
jgi:methylmalonyl-CoA/ethylmalonyl-CoA epimerase